MMITIGDLKDTWTGPDGRMVVMAGQQVLLLSELASELLRALADGPLMLESLAAHLEGVFGAPDHDSSSEPAVRALVEDLSGRQIVAFVKPA
ncbi:hypothetical protein [Nocardioides sp. LS1]|uniref:hypothetical protein n=1 Tax=Nocardioides sp. LS1 TaxID=1027620 RepID=UPI000F619A33|nr:hypothetical protein [Nocardioides sp. LS1]GCD90651.1 hypothetical protein NLS1_26570 [Nocardioides sp. LS1]